MPFLDLVSATSLSGGRERNSYGLRAATPSSREEAARWCAFDTAAAMSMTSDRGRICPGTRHQVDVDIVPYGAGATRVREAGTMLVRSRGRELLLTNTLLTKCGPTIMAWGPLAKKGCTCLLGGTGGALYDSKGALFATMRIHAQANILVIRRKGCASSPLPRGNRAQDTKVCSIYSAERERGLPKGGPHC